MPFTDFMPAIVVGKCPEGRAKLIEMTNEEPVNLWGRIYECDQFAYTRHPVYTDDDLWRPKDQPVCANRNRSGVRDMNMCCRCLSGLPATFQYKNDEAFSDAPIRL